MQERENRIVKYIACSFGAAMTSFQTPIDTIYLIIDAAV